MNKNIQIVIKINFISVPKVKESGAILSEALAFALVKDRYKLIIFFILFYLILNIINNFNRPRIFDVLCDFHAQFSKPLNFLYLIYVMLCYFMLFYVMLIRLFCFISFFFISFSLISIIAISTVYSSENSPIASFLLLYSLKKHVCLTTKIYIFLNC